jgi:mannose-6-phosphate isomerase-like protein (cupin superfamily)
MTHTTPFDLMSTYVNLGDDGRTRPIEGGDAFWSQLGNGQLPSDVSARSARLIALFDVATDWTSWEMHPGGDELVYVIAGSMDLLLEEPGGVRTVTLETEQGYIVPRGIWHTANARQRAKVLHVTPGAGTEQRSRR